MGAMVVADEALHQVRGPAGGPAELDEGAEGLGPHQLGDELADVLAARLGPGLVVGRETSASARAIDVLRGTVRPRPLRSIRSARESPLGGDDRQVGPQVVEHPGAEREVGLDVVEVRADADVGIEQVVLPVVVVAPSPR